MDESYRSQLLQIDQDVLRLVAKRSQLLTEWEQTRSAAGLTPLSLDQCQTQAQKDAVPMPGLSAESLRLFLRQLADASRQLIPGLQRIAYLGPPYSFSHLAGVQYFGERMEYVPVTTIGAVFDEVSRGHSQRGIVPIQNSTDGRVNDTLTLFSRYQLTIVGETILPIHHCLMGRCKRHEVREVHSKPQALSQCRSWLSKHLPEAKLVEISSTTAAARFASEHPGVAAIASREAAQPYGLSIIDANIEDHANNHTRFVILGREGVGLTGEDKTSLLFHVSHHPGALADAIHVFREAGLNLTWIESLPSHVSPDEYQFFVELNGHRSQPAVADCIHRLEAITLKVQVLGSYPVAKV